ncbi:extracellular catalytic domain type 1 short-chain-length polyhydroxyalkanoate depolymerase [Hyalangium versicolor]|uniref:extracellular catalytic domain type 1 short-chain-length polyhydroxyalkanoate depolymerase n=1 Tax=Hyalangium versicolor TaxID=2861190 RepID=UPI001CCE932A|nr:PHB depolymerase family esterase [Hyalangium versicolor]
MALTHRSLCLGATLLLLGATGCDDSSKPPAVPDAGAPGPIYPPIVDRTSCSGLTVGPGNYTWTIRHENRTRSYNVHVPTGYDATKPTPIVVAFHGFASNAQEQEGLSRMSELADEKGFLAVYPQGLSYTDIQPAQQDAGAEDTQSWNAGGCCGPAQIYGVNDVDFVEAIFKDLDTRVCVDTRRTYATGMSNGAFFTYRLACDRAERFAAIAPVAGMENVVTCSPSRPVPVMHFHGTADPTISYDGGTIPFGRPYPSAPATVAKWAERNGCTGALQETYQKGDSTCVTHTGCTAPATLCTVQGGGHTWPGGLIPPSYGYTTMDLDATREMWSFFEAHPRP